MRISFDYNFVYYSNPRCGSHSIRNKLGKYSNIRVDGNPNNISLRAHSRCSEVSDWFKNKKLYWNDFLHFISIRNPWDKVISLYYFGLPTKDEEYHWSISGKAREELINSGKLMPFKEWVMTGTSKHDKYFNYITGECKKDYISNDISHWSLKRYICNKYGRILIDEVIRLEHLEEDFKNKIQPKLNLPNFNYKFNHLNAGNYKDRPKRDYKTFYDKESKEKIEELYFLDIKLGNYKY